MSFKMRNSLIDREANFVLSFFMSPLPLWAASIGIVFPYFIIALLFFGLKVLMAFGVIFLVCTGLGYLFVLASLSFLDRYERVLYAGPAGFVILSILFQFSAWKGWPLAQMFWGVAAICVPGVILLARQLWKDRTTLIPGGFALSCISILVAIVYFGFPSFRNAVVTEEGGVPFLYFSDFLLSIVTGINTGFIPPRNPGFLDAQLVYHYGPYALAACLSKVTHVSSSASLFHVIRGVALIYVFGATVGMSRVLSRGSVRSKIAIPFGIIGLFFTGSFTALFSGDLLPKLKGADAGMVNLIHYMTSFSLLWTHVGLIMVMGVLFARTMKPISRGESQWGLFLLPGLMVSCNIFAALNAAGLIAAAMVWMGHRRLTHWLSAGTTFGVFLCFAAATNMLGSSSAPSYFIDTDASSSLFRLFGWTVLGLGIRIYGFQMIKDLRRDPKGWIVCLLTMGSMIPYLLISDSARPDLGGETDQYFLIIWQGLFGVFAMVMLSEPLEAYMRRDREPKARLIGSFLSLYVKVGGLFLAAGAIYLLVEVIRRTDKTYSLSTMVLASILIGGAWFLKNLYGKMKWTRGMLESGFLLVVALSLCAWFPHYLNFGLRQAGIRTYLATGEVEGLRRLRDVSRSNDLTATNRHNIFGTYPCSYSYSAISERQMLLEGYHFCRSEYHPTFEAIKLDNGLLFSTNDAGIAHSIVKKYGIKYIACQPGTDIHFVAPGVDWLNRIEPSGTLKLYGVVKDGYPNMQRGALVTVGKEPMH